MIKYLSGGIYGMVYGASLLIPGLSGGTFLVIFGCYDKICAAFALDFKLIKKHFIFYLFFGFGAVIGIVASLLGIRVLFDSFPTQTYLFFLGLIMGGVPFILKTATSEERFKPMCIVPFLFGLLAIIGLFVVENAGVFGDSAGEAATLGFSIRMGVYAFFTAIAMVLPGISGALVLTAFGAYRTFMDSLSLSNPNLSVLVPAAIGGILGIVGGAKLVRFLLRKYKLMVYSAIIGMVVGSIVPVLGAAQARFNLDSLIGAFCMIAGIVIVAMLSRVNKSEA
jgi:putative membrane protein